MEPLVETFRIPIIMHNALEARTNPTISLLTTPQSNAQKPEKRVEWVLLATIVVGIFFVTTILIVLFGLCYRNKKRQRENTENNNVVTFDSTAENFLVIANNFIDIDFPTTSALSSFTGDDRDTNGRCIVEELNSFQHKKANNASERLTRVGIERHCKSTSEMQLHSEAVKDESDFEILNQTDLQCACYSKTRMSEAFSIDLDNVRNEKDFKQHNDFPMVKNLNTFTGNVVNQSNVKK